MTPEEPAALAGGRRRARGARERRRSSASSPTTDRRLREGHARAAVHGQDLLRARRGARARASDDDVAIVRIEQLYPLRMAELARGARRAYTGRHAECFWVQDEPRNMGAWPFVTPRIGTSCSTAARSSGRCISRPRERQPGDRLAQGARASSSSRSSKKPSHFGSADEARPGAWSPRISSRLRAWPNS